MEDNTSPRLIPTSVQELALWIAGVLLTLSCFGFLRLLAEHLEHVDLSVVGSETLLFGLFHVSVLHNIVHLLLGAGAVVSAGSLHYCRRFLAITGGVMLALVLYGVLDQTPLILDLAPTGTADTWLHAILAVTMLVAGTFRSGKRRTPLGSA
ncbi:DUF4383 domain-containing protein [Kribbella speibonae]|uniref:DUF4383 domain-containing protein n=1 Tax=Kribbella speibonae TaxID=1572660 RepID=UPI0013F47FAC|nr:DUF4383 domain-containing protein [Kribbella speibonae]